MAAASQAIKRRSNLKVLCYGGLCQHRDRTAIRSADVGKAQALEGPSNPHEHGGEEADASQIRATAEFFGMTNAQVVEKAIESYLARLEPRSYAVTIRKMARLGVVRNAELLKKNAERRAAEKGK